MNKFQQLEQKRQQLLARLKKLNNSDTSYEQYDDVVRSIEREIEDIEEHQLALQDDANDQGDY